MRLELHPEARAELRSAALWYDEQRPGLGDEFIADVSEAFNRVARLRILPGMVGHAGRRPADPQGAIQRFPYVIAFEKHERHMLVLAVAHAERRPLSWLTRAQP